MITNFPGYARWTIRFFFALTAISILSLSGCGIGPEAPSEPSVAAPGSITGHLRGGEQAIQNATITIYSTVNTATGSGGIYTGSATNIAHINTDSNGNFTFTSSPTCTSPDQVYFVASGGNTGSNSANSQILLMAAVGDCSKLTTSLFVNIDEVTTVAAVYALNHFTTLSGSTVNVASSATNYAGTSGTGTASNAAGLAHAFLNATNLADYDAGAAYTSVPGNSNSVVPAAVINGLADVLQSCVNSTGGAATAGSVALTPSTPTTPTASVGASFTLTFASASDTATGTLSIKVGTGSANTLTIPAGTTETGLVSLISNNAAYSNLSAMATSTTVITVTGPVGTANTLTVSPSVITDENNDGTACGRLMGAATPPGGSVPTNTLQAMLNIAREPAYNASDIFSLITAMPAFTPVITSAPTDWSIGISYGSLATGIGQTVTLNTYLLTLDANDNVYAEVLYPNVSSSTSSCITSLSSKGTLNSGTGWDCSLASSGSLLKQMAADQNGYIWITDGSASPYNAVQQINASTGAQKATFNPSESSTHTTQAVAVDKNGDVWFNSSGSGATLSEIVLSGGTYASAVSKSNSTNWVSALGLAIDSSQNVWGDVSATSPTKSAAVYSPTNSNTAQDTTDTTTLAYYGFAIDKNGYAWAPYGTDTIASYTYTSSSSSPAVSQGTSGQQKTVTSSTLLPNVGYSEVDGNNVLWIAQRTTPGVSAYNISSNSSSFTSSMPGATQPYKGCLATSAVSCQVAGSSLFSVPYDLQIDATGSIWVTGGYNATSTDGNLVQLIGMAAPAWPLLATGKPGVMP